MACYEPDIKFNIFSTQSYFLTLTSEGDFIMNTNGVSFNLNNNDCIKISLTSADLPMTYSTHLVDVTSDDLALITCATDAGNVNLPQTQNGCFNGTIGWSIAVSSWCSGLRVKAT